MESMKRKIGLVVAAGVLVAIPVAWLFWDWIIERVEVKPGETLIVINKWGRNLPEGEIIAPDDSYKGILEEPRRPLLHQPDLPNLRAPRAQQAGRSAQWPVPGVDAPLRHADPGRTAQ